MDVKGATAKVMAIAVAKPAEPMDVDQQNAETSEREKKEIAEVSLNKLRRFCFISSFETVFLRTSFDLTEKSNIAALRDLCAKVDHEQLFKLLHNVLSATNADFVPRHNEALIVLAVYLTTKTDEKQRTFMRAQFPILVGSGNDLVTFMNYVKIVQKALHRKTPFSRTVRKAVIEWYMTRSLESLLDMWSLAEPCSHCAILKRCHYSEVAFEPDIKAALRLMCTKPQEIIYWPSYLEPLNSFKNLITGVAQLRLTHYNFSSTLSLIERLSFAYKHVPSRLIRDVEVVMFLLPSMSYEELLESWQKFLPIIHHYPENFVKYRELFFDKTRLRNAQIEPIQILLQSTIKVQGLTKHASANCSIIKMYSFMDRLYKVSFGYSKPLNLKIHITLNLEKFYLRKTVFGHNDSIEYIDALIAIAFGYYKSNANVDVNYWCDRTASLKALPWSQAMSEEEAKACCENVNVTKIRQSLTEIIRNALRDDAKTYNLFLVIAPAGTRGNPGQSSATLHKFLEIYRKSHSVDAKLVILSLRHNRESMDYSGSPSNILELCGVDKDTPKLIRAFATGQF